MATKCEYCDHEFINVLMRRDCPKCGQSLRKPADTYTSNNTQASKPDDGFDATGFAIGMATGIPLSPAHGISTGSILGAALHSNPSHSAPAADPAPSPSPSCDTSSSASSSYDSSSSSSCSSDSGGGGGGGSD